MMKVADNSSQQMLEKRNSLATICLSSRLLWMNENHHVSSKNRSYKSWAKLVYKGNYKTRNTAPATPKLIV